MSVSVFFSKDVTVVFLLPICKSPRDFTGAITLQNGGRSSGVLAVRWVSLTVLRIITNYFFHGEHTAAKYTAQS